MRVFAALVLLPLSGCTPDAAAFIQAAGTRSACLHVTAPWGTVDAWTMNQNNSSIKPGCDGNQGQNLQPLPPSIVLLGPQGQAQVLKP